MFMPQVGVSQPTYSPSNFYVSTAVSKYKRTGEFHEKRKMWLGVQESQNYFYFCLSGLGGGLRMHLTSTGRSEIRSEILSISRPDSYQNPLLCDEWVGYGHKTSQNPGAITIFWAFL
jgi:hypothetical protein